MWTMLRRFTMSGRSPVVGSTQQLSVGDIHGILGHPDLSSAMLQRGWSDATERMKSLSRQKTGGNEPVSAIFLRAALQRILGYLIPHA